AKNVMDQLIRGGKVTRGHLGVGIQRLTPELASSFGLKNTEGVLINSVEAGGPADKAGVKVGDVIMNLNGQAIEDANSFRNKIASSSPGTDVTLDLLREGKSVQVRAKLDELKPNEAGQQPAGRAPQPTSGPQLGMT